MCIANLPISTQTAIRSAFWVGGINVAETLKLADGKTIGGIFAKGAGGLHLWAPRRSQHWAHSVHRELEILVWLLWASLVESLCGQWILERASQLCLHQGTRMLVELFFIIVLSISNTNNLLANNAVFCLFPVQIWPPPRGRCSPTNFILMTYWPS